MKELNKFVYQIYPKSFKDTTGNGIGDINGIREKLEYIKDLGFDYIWVTPMYVSPQNDNGYDVANYTEVDPLFGTKEDLKCLVDEASKLGIGIMMDMVFNHTSIDHEWFKKAIVGEKKYQDYYIWRDQPTNWESKFGGNAWEYVESLDKYYLHLFDKTQADLNWENEEVRNEIYNIVNYWLEFGIKGFRFDVMNLISKKYPLVDGDGDGRREYTDGPRIHEFLEELRSNTFADDQTILTIGEMSSTSIGESIKYSNRKRTELDSVFHFHHLKVDYENGEKWSKDYFDFEMLKRLFVDWQTAMNDNNCVDTLFWCCHDQPRIASRFIKANNKTEQLRKNKTYAMMMYLMRGISYVFQGEEIGMENVSFDNISQFNDVESINYYNANEQLSSDERLAILREKSRDNARTPMQWTREGGFSSIDPWIEMNENYKEINVENQLLDNDSTHEFYKQLIALKKNNEVLVSGSIDFLDDDKLMMYKRTLGNQTYMVIANVWDEQMSIKQSFKDVIINNGCELAGGEIKLLPFSSILINI